LNKKYAKEFSKTRKLLEMIKKFSLEEAILEFFKVLSDKLNKTVTYGCMIGVELCRLYLYAELGKKIYDNLL